MILHNYIGLDTATVMGIAVYVPELNKAYVVQIKGSPIEQLTYIFEKVIVSFSEETERIIIFEMQHNFRSATVTRSLLERYGYLKYSLLCTGLRVEEVSPKVARHFLNEPGKEEVFRKFIPYYSGSMFTSNHADALAIALYQADQDGFKLDLENFKIVNFGVL